MKISCNIIQDLLPLYAENLCYQDTNALITEHLATCKQCTDRLSLLKAPIPILIEPDSSPLKPLKKVIYKKLAYSIAIALLILLPFLIFLQIYVFGIL